MDEMAAPHMSRRVIVFQIHIVRQSWLVGHNFLSRPVLQLASLAGKGEVGLQTTDSGGAVRSPHGFSLQL